MCWNKALTFGVGSIKLSFRTIVFTQYMQRCFQSKCYYHNYSLKYWRELYLADCAKIEIGRFSFGGFRVSVCHVITRE